MTINDLALRTTKAMLEAGYADYTAWSYYGNVFTPIIKFFEQQGEMEYSTQTMDEFVRHIEERADQGAFSGRWYNWMKRGVTQLRSYHDTGKISFYWLSKTSKFKLSEYYDGVLSEFLSNNDYHPNTRGDIVWVAKKYFAWLIMDGHKNLSTVGVSEVQRFLYYCFGHLKSGSIHNVKLYMKKLYHYLAGAGHATSDYAELLSFQISRGSSVLPDVPAEELAQTLAVIDRRTPLGKRNYAIILLGAVIGLRACDIIRLQLSDIDWIKGEIKIVQAKTWESLALPLTKDVGEALKEYILTARPKTECEHIFIRRNPPHRGLTNAVAVGDIYDAYRKKAGLPRDAFDGKGFHSLRRSVGKNLVTSGTPVTTVAQILGHGDIESTKQYISLDSRHLRECALDFSGIEVTSHA